MGWKKLVILFSFSFLMQNCIVKSYYFTEFNSTRPKKNNFKLSQNPYTLKTDSPISSKNVYIKKETIEIKDAITKEKKILTINSFIRFFENGRYINSTTNKSFVNGLQDYNNLKRGIIGYYRIEDKKIIFEDFIVGSHDNGKYKIYERNLINDSIEGYKKLKIEGLTGIPDW